MREDSAAAATIGFAIALALFMAGIGYVLLATTDIQRGAATSDGAVDSVSAATLADLLTGSPGIGWAGDVDDLSRLGFQASNGSGLSAAALDAMRGGVFAATDNDLLDYDEARLSLGLAADEQFHIRMIPANLVFSLQEADLGHLRVAYIGDWSGAPSTLVALGSEPDMIAASQAAADGGMGSLVGAERGSIVSLGADFNDIVALDFFGWSVMVDLPVLPDVRLDTLVPGMALEGDVYPDIKAYLDTMIPDRLDEYDVLIVGSQVDQSSLTSAVTKDKIRDWTLAGGTLVVLGSDAQNFQWLQPLFGVGVSSVNGGAYAPDANHPVLLQPYDLSWPDYDNHGFGWDIKDTGSGAHYDDFSHVIVEDDEDILAISDEGAFGTGRIFLTTYRPGEIAGALGVGEATGFISNMILYHDRSHLYLEYGPTVPQDLQVLSAQRVSHIWDAELGQVPVRIDVLYWRSASTTS